MGISPRKNTIGWPGPTTLSTDPAALQRALMARGSRRRFCHTLEGEIFTMKILVINAGSSSIKYQLFDMDQATVLASGIAERIGENQGAILHDSLAGQKRRVVREHVIANHHAALTEIVEVVTNSDYGVIRNKSEISAVAHRVVHGGEAFQHPTIIEDTVLSAIRQNIPLAPLHNPPNLTGIEVARSIFPDVPQVAVFDTAFHQTIPHRAFHYALPQELYNNLRIRRYGFHGTSHQYVAKEAAKFLRRPLAELNLITLHLGNGASMTAIEKGHSVDTSMGMTPLEGLIMGTRCGDIDPAIHLYLSQQTGKTIQEIDNLLNKQSGLKGLCGVNDMREIQAKEKAGDADAQLALEMYAYRIKKYIGAYFAVLGKVDALVFTAGIGENSAEVRERSCRGLTAMGIVLDAQKNGDCRRGIREIQSAESKVKILVVPTNEEMEIARQTFEILKSCKK